MPIVEIEQKDWQSYFDSFSRRFLKDKQPEYAEIRVLSKSMGMQPETQWLPLEGISFSPREGLLDIRLEQLDHRIWHPIRIFVDQESDGWITSMEVEQEDGTKDIIELR